MRVTLVTGDSAGGRYLAAYLARTGVLDRVVLERPRLPRRFLLRKLSSPGPFEAAFQFWLTRRFRHEVARVLPALPLGDHETTPDVNALRFAADELVIAFGTSYVRRSTLQRSPMGILNLHTGLLPEYRGVKSEFWCQFNRDPLGAGWTLHHMTERLDAGDIVLRHVVPWKGESPGELRARILLDAAPRLVAFIAQARDGGPVPRQPQGPGTYYSAPRFRQWRAVRRRTGGWSVPP